MKFEKLGNICYVRNGYAFKSELFNDDGVPIIRISDINDNYVTSKNSIRILYDKAFEQFKLSKGDILIAMSGATTGKYGIYCSEEIGYQNQRVGCFVIKDKAILDNTYLLQNLKYLKPKIEKKAHGSGQPNISAKAIEDFEIPLPSLPAQLHIASLLSKAESLIAQRKESIRLLDEFLKSTFLEMFGDPVRNEKGWKKTKLSDVCTKIGSGSTPNGGKESYHKEGISLIRSLNVHNDEFVYDDLAFIDDKQAHELRNVVIEQNDVLLNITGASVARCCVVPKGILPARVNQHVSILRPDANKLNHLFLSRMFTARAYQLYLIKNAKSKGATRESITKEYLEMLEIILPPIKLQNRFAQIVEKTEALKTQYQQSLLEFENLYGSLSQRAFKGELTVDKAVSV